MKKNNPLQIVIIVIAVVLGSFFGRFAVDYFFQKSNSFDKKLIEAANAVNNACPMMVDNETQLDNAVALPNNTFQYNYTLVNYLKKDVNIEKIKKNLSSRILNYIKTNPSLEMFRNNKVTLIYSYSDKNGVFLFSLEYKYDDYKK